MVVRARLPDHRPKAKQSTAGIDVLPGEWLAMTFRRFPASLWLSTTSVPQWSDWLRSGQRPFHARGRHMGFAEPSPSQCGEGVVDRRSNKRRPHLSCAGWMTAGRDYFNVISGTSLMRIT